MLKGPLQESLVSIRLVLADDHARFRASLSRLLAEQPDLEVAGQGRDAATALSAVLECARTGAPPVLLVDVEMPGGGGMAATRAVLAACPQVRVLALSMHDEVAFVDAMVAAGALGYSLKGDPLPELLHAIHEVAAGNRYRSPSLG